ncbi:MAG: hypothetical protein HYW06_00465 [Gemmatimonadetes bacterium]|nr:hypothetical protein [Gemmatimonadota bacterium]
MTRGGTAFGKPAQPEPPGLADRLKALRHKPKTLAALALVAVLGALAWATREPETWITVNPTEIRIAVGASQQLSVALTYKPRFRFRRSARSIAGTVQLISFPSAVDVAPTTMATSGSAPEATLKVTGLREGQEELILAASNTPTDQRSWQTTSVRVVVTR